MTATDPITEQAARSLIVNGPAVGRFLRRCLESGPERLPMLAYGVLRCLCEAGPQSNLSLAARAGVSAPTMSATVDHLVRAGWVERDIDPTDRRAVAVSVTPEGRKAFRRVRRDLVGAVSRLLDGIDPQALEGFVAVMTALGEELSCRRAAEVTADGKGRPAAAASRRRRS